MKPGTQILLTYFRRRNTATPKNCCEACTKQRLCVANEDRKRKMETGREGLRASLGAMALLLDIAAKFIGEPKLGVTNTGCWGTQLKNPKSVLNRLLKRNEEEDRKAAHTNN